MNPELVAELAEALLDAYARGTPLASISAAYPEFDVDAAYEVLREVERRRVAMGWQPVGRKIGFTNRTIWPRYNVYRPMWAHVWRETVQHAPAGEAAVSLSCAAEPRLEPEVVFGLNGPLTLSDDPRDVLRAVDWIAPGFEVVQSQFPGWKFTSPDCTAAFGLHRALVVGRRTQVTAAERDALAQRLPVFEVALRRGSEEIERGVGANVLGGPAHALAHLARVLADQPQMPPLAAGELVTTGTITDAWPVRAGETWSSDYGTLGIAGLVVRFL